MTIWTSKRVAVELGVTVRRVQQIARAMGIETEKIDRARIFKWPDVMRMKRRENRRKGRDSHNGTTNL